jgi:hypothetical protein
LLVAQRYQVVIPLIGSPRRRHARPRFAALTER